MRALAVVLRHELAERRLLLLGGALLGAAPLFAAFMPGVAPGAVPEMRDTIALFLALAVSGLAALLLGATAVASDLAERRLGFFFSRPIPGWTLWAGKLGGATACAAAAGLLVLVPAWLVDAVATGGVRSPVEPPILVLWVVAVPVAVLAAHAGSIMLRSRSAWLILDLAAVDCVVAIAWLTTRRLLYWGVWSNPERLAPLFAAGAGIALLAASAVQVLSGRTDLQRGHRRLSATLAACGLAVALGFAGLAQVWLTVGPQDLREWRWMWAAPGNRWVAVTGPVHRLASFDAAFFLQPATGRAVRIQHGPGLYALTFSADGSRAAWLEYPDLPRTSPRALQWLDLERAGATPVRAAVAVDPLARALALSPRGSRVAVLLDNRIEVSNLANGRLLAAPAVPNGIPVDVRFADEDHLRLLVRRSGQADSGELDAYVLDLATRKLRQQAGVAKVGPYWRLSPDGSRITFTEPDRGHAVIVDLASGRRIEDPLQLSKVTRVHFSADNRVVEVARGPAGTEVALFGDDGSRPGLASRFTFPAGTSIQQLLPAGPDHLLALQTTERPGAAGQGWLNLDLRHGTVQPLGKDLHLAWPATADAGPAPLFNDGKHLLQIDLATGNRRTLGPARPWQAGS